MGTIILFDQDVQHYRIPIYREFKRFFQKEVGLNLVVIYDLKNNSQIKDDDLFIGIKYSFRTFKDVIKKFKPNIIIQFVWLRYRFLIPFMIWTKFKKISLILWSHGINLQNRNQVLKNHLYYLRQKLSNALIIYTPEQKQYLKVNSSKVFVANNTLNFDELPKIELLKSELKNKYNLVGKKVLLSVGRMNANNRSPEQLVKLSKLFDNSIKILIIGPGVEDSLIDEISNLENIDYLGPIFNQEIVSEYYKLSDIFIMPGAIGLAINQAFYYETPVIIEDVDHGPEAYYLENNENGFIYKSNDIQDLKEKIEIILKPETYKFFCKNAINTVNSKASFETMTKGFIDAINFVKNI